MRATIHDYIKFANIILRLNYSLFCYETFCIKNNHFAFSTYMRENMMEENNMMRGKMFRYIASPLKLGVQVYTRLFMESDSKIYFAHAMVVVRKKRVL